MVAFWHMMQNLRRSNESIAIAMKLKEMGYSTEDIGLFMAGIKDFDGQGALVAREPYASEHVETIAEVREIPPGFQAIVDRYMSYDDAEAAIADYPKGVISDLFALFGMIDSHWDRTRTNRD